MTDKRDCTYLGLGANSELLYLHRFTDLFAGALIVGLTLFAFFAATEREVDGEWGFINFDDKENFLDIEKEFKTVSILSLDSMSWALEKNILNVWEPLSWLTKLFLSQSIGFEARTFRVASLACHILSSILLYRMMVQLQLFLRKVPRKNSFPGKHNQIFLRLCSLGGSLFFALHPCGVQVIAWASAFPYSLAMLFQVLSMFVYVTPRLRFPSNGWKDGNLVSLSASGVFFLMATLFKSYSVFAPIVLGAFEIFLFEFQILGLNANKLVLLLARRSIFLIAIVVQCAKSWQIENGCKNLLFEFGWKDLVAFVPTNIAHMFALTVWPVNLQPYYSVSQIALKSWQSMEICGGFVSTLVFIGWTSSCLANNNTERRGVGIGLLWYLIALFPGSGLISHNLLHLGDDRYVYMGLPGICFSVCIFLFRMGRLEESFTCKVRRVLTFTLGMTCVLIGFVYIDRGQMYEWRNAYYLLKNSSQKSPNDCLLHEGFIDELAKSEVSKDILRIEIDSFRDCLEALKGSPRLNRLKYHLTRSKPLVLLSVENFCAEQSKLMIQFSKADYFAASLNNVAVCSIIEKSRPLNEIMLLFWESGNKTVCKRDLDLIESNLRNLEQMLMYGFKPGLRFQML